MSEAILVVTISFSVSFIASYLVGTIASGVPITPWFVRNWVRRLKGKKP